VAQQQGSVLLQLSSQHASFDKGSGAAAATCELPAVQEAARAASGAASSSRSSRLPPQQQIRARLRRLQSKQQQQEQQQQQRAVQQQVLVDAAVPEMSVGSQGTVHALSPLLSALQRQHLPGLMSGGAEAVQALSEGAVARLDRKLTSILAECTSWQDVAAVLAAADSTGRLNSVHVAAAAARLARLAAVERAQAVATAAAPPSVSSAVHSEVVLSGIVPESNQQRLRMGVVRKAVAAAAAAGWHTRWHPADSQPAAAAAAVQQGTVGAAGQPVWSHDDGDEGCEAAAAVDVARQHLLEQLCLAVADAWPSMSAASMTGAAWSLAVLGESLPEGLLPAVACSLLDMAGALQQARQEQQAWQPSSSSRSSSSSSIQTGRAVYKTCELPRQLVVLLWSLATMGIEPEDLQPNPPSDQQQQQGASSSSTVMSSSAVPAVLCALLPVLPSLSFQGLSMLLWALGTWRISPAAAGRDAAAGDAAAAAAAAEEALLAASAGALQAGAAQGCAQGLAVQLWALARLGLCPPPDWMAAWLAAMWAALPAANSHDCAMAAWALATLGVAPPGDWLAALCSRAGQLAPQLGPQELPPLLWALARLRYRPQLRVAQALLLRGQALAAAGRLSPQGLALLLWAPAGLGLAPRGGWVDAVLAAAAAYLPLFRPPEGAALLVGLARLQHIPPAPWMQEWWSQSAGMLPYAEGRQLVLLLWAAVQLGQAPPAAWMRAWQLASARAMAAGQLSSQGYGIMWAALQQLEPALPPAWLNVYWQTSSQPAVLHSLDCLAAERSLTGLAAVSNKLPEGLSPPRQWAAAFLAASQLLLPGANLDNLAGMLLAAGQLQLALPQPWLAAAMARLVELLAAQGVISTGSSSSSKAMQSVRAHVSLALAARLQRRRLALQLQRVLAGLRAQQMLAAPAARRAGAGAAAAAAGSRERLGVADALSTWPWLADAVRATWRDSRSAEQALTALSGRS
jgi:hypothetical protein